MRAWPAVFAAPHRGFFAIGTAQALLAMLFWAIDLAGRYGGLWQSPQWPLPSQWLHGLLLIHGVFGSFMFGFILTAGPRWQQQEAIAPRAFRPPVLLMGLGWLTADLGLLLPLLLPAGLLLVAVAWWLATVPVWRLAGGTGDVRHIRLAAAALSAGGIGLLAFFALAAGGAAWLGPLAIQVGIWCTLVPVFTVVLHRMLPFFSQGVIRDFPRERPFWPLWLLLAGSVGHGILQTGGLAAATWLVDLPAAAAGFYLVRQWRFRASFADRILAVLHLGFGWLPVAFLAFGSHSLMLAAGGGGLGLAPLHGLTIGCLSSLLVGMASRVTLGHSGRPIVADRVMWACFWSMQAAAILRMAADFLWPVLNPLAALLWLGALAAWAVRYAPAYWLPRMDGEAG